MPPPIHGAHQFCAPRCGPASGLLAVELAISRERAIELIRFGAVYYRYARLKDDAEVGAGEWLRVHIRPRRFTVAVSDWRERIIGETADYVVVDKPAGLPVHPTCDNGIENLLHQMQSTLARELFVCQRLDIATSGLVVLAKTRAFRVAFGRWLEEHAVEKLYRALVPCAVPLGAMVHYQSPDERGPKQVSESPRKGWRRCELRVLSCHPVEGDFQASLRLITGRTHQIRCQLAARRAPILGDTLYGSERLFGEGERIALWCAELALPDGQRFFLPD